LKRIIVLAVSRVEVWVLMMLVMGQVEGVDTEV
jgi:hypothetical protein